MRIKWPKPEMVATALRTIQDELRQRTTDKLVYTEVRLKVRANGSCCVQYDIDTLKRDYTELTGESFVTLDTDCEARAEGLLHSAKNNRR